MGGNKYLKHVVFPEGLITLGVSALNGATNVESVTLPNSLQSIGAFAFANTAIEELVVGDQIESLDEIGNPFSFMDNLKHLVILGGKDLAIPNLIGLDNLETLYVGDGITSIDDWSFFNCNKLKSVVIRDDIDYIGSWAFTKNANITFYINPDTTTYQMVEDMKIGTVKPYEPMNVNVSCSPASVTPGSTPTISVTSNGGVGDKQYRFVQVVDGSEIELQGYSSSSVMNTWKIEDSSAVIRVYVKDSTALSVSKDLVVGEKYVVGNYIAKATMTDTEHNVVSPMNALLNEDVLVTVGESKNDVNISFADNNKYVTGLKYNGKDLLPADEQTIIGGETYLLEDVDLISGAELTLTTTLQESPVTVHINIDMASAQAITSKEKLNSILTEAYKLNGARYTEETWTAVDNAMKKAFALLEDNWSKQEDINNAVSELENAIAALVRNDLPGYVWPEAGRYNIKLNLNELDVPDGFMEMVNRNTTLVVNGNGTYEILLTFGPGTVGGNEVNGQNIALVKYRTPDYDYYDAEMVSEDLDAGTRTYRIVCSSLDYYGLIQVNLNTQVSYPAFWLGLDQSSISLPIPNDKAEKEALLTIYNFCRMLDLSIYEDGQAKDDFNEALNKAAEVAADKDADQAAVDEAAKQLTDAFATLSINDGITYLKNTLNLINQYDEERYTPDTWQELMNVKEEAQAGLNGSITENEAVELATRLLQAAFKLAYKADKTSLMDAVANAKAIDMSLYTEESLAGFRTALEKAEALLNDGNLTEDDQLTISDAIVALGKAQSNLVKKAEEQVKTGDTNNMTVFIWLMFVSGIALCFLKKKRIYSK